MNSETTHKVNIQYSQQWIFMKISVLCETIVRYYKISGRPPPRKKEKKLKKRDIIRWGSEPCNSVNMLIVKTMSWYFQWYFKACSYG